MRHPLCFAAPSITLGSNRIQGRCVPTLCVPTLCVSSTSHYAAQVIGYPATRSRITMEDDGLSGTFNKSDDKMTRVRLTDIRKQMEFWFSNVNLRRDWYLRRCMDADGWIDPSVFLNFNLIKRLNATLGEIIEACRLSSIVEVSTPNDTFGDSISQTRIRKASSPLVPTENESLDEETARSVIVEKLPSDSSHESIRKIFSAYGEVTYVWLPKKTGGLLRGYALVLYETASAATRAITRFKEDQSRGKVPSQMMVQSKIEWERTFTSKKIGSTVIMVTGVSPKTSWRNLWNVLQPKFTLSSIQLLYLSFRHGDNHCYVTIRDGGEVQQALDAVFQNLVVDGQKLSGEILTDPEALSKYWSIAAKKMSQRKRKLAESGGETDTAESMFTPGIIVKVNGLPEDLHWRTVLGELRQRGDVVFLKYDQESGECFVRFASPLIAAESVKVISSTPLCGHEVTAAVLKGEEEEQYWAAVNRQKRYPQRQRQGSSVSKGPLPTEGEERDIMDSSTRDEAQQIFGNGELIATTDETGEEKAESEECRSTEHNTEVPEGLHSTSLTNDNALRSFARTGAKTGESIGEESPTTSGSHRDHFTTTL